MGPIEKLKDIWNSRLSTEGQSSVLKNAALMGGAILGGLILSALSFPSVVAIPVISGIVGHGAINLMAPDSRVRADIGESEHLIEWKNDARQTVQGTTIQFVKLHEAERKISGLFESLSNPSTEAVNNIRQRFSGVAAGVRVVEDVPNGTGDFMYSGRGGQLIPAAA